MSWKIDKAPILDMKPISRSKFFRTNSRRLMTREGSQMMPIIVLETGKWKGWGGKWFIHREHVYLAIHNGKREAQAILRFYRIPVSSLLEN